MICGDSSLTNKISELERLLEGEITEDLFNNFIINAYPITISIFSYLIYTYHSEIYNSIDACYDLGQEFFNYFTIDKLRTYNKAYPFYPWYKTIVFHFFFERHRRKTLIQYYILNEIDLSNIIHQLITNEKVYNYLKKTLSKKQLDIFLLRYLYNLSNNKIARIVNCSISSVKRNNHYILNEVIKIKIKDK